MSLDTGLRPSGNAGNIAVTWRMYPTLCQVSTPKMPTPPEMPRAARSPSNGRLASAVRAERWGERGIDYLNQLRAFCLAARCGSITRAAEQLSATQPLVSAHVSALENALGAQLFDRRKRCITLTRAGEALHRLAEPLVTSVDRLHGTFLERCIGTSPGAVLAIGAGRDSAAHVLPSYLKQFQTQYPDARVQVRTGPASKGSPGFAATKSTSSSRRWTFYRPTSSSTRSWIPSS